MNTNSNITQEQLEAIERYLNGTMPSEELIDFKSQLSSNPELKQQVEDIRTLLSGIETQSLKEQLDVFHKDINPNTPKKVSPAKVRYLEVRKWIAAAALIIAAGSFWILNQNSNDKLFDSYFTPDPGLPTTMSSSSNYSFYDAMVNYKQGEYALAIEKWEALPSQNDTTNYFIGVSYLALDDDTTAISYLEKSVLNKDFPLIEDGHYYLGLAYLKNGNIALAKENLNKSSSEESKALLLELNK
ncbi:MAG: hypothetical protein HRU26_02170 [Psychroserpens sp.]|nr:hypothetical protein [Psychroserpens sp.]